MATEVDFAQSRSQGSPLRTTGRGENRGTRLDFAILGAVFPTFSSYLYKIKDSH